VLRARAYIRVSHVGKARQDTLLSDAMQLDEAKRYCAFADLTLDEASSKEYADLDVSGFRKPWRQRPGLMAHYEAARRGEFDVLVFYKISRLGRNVREALDLIDAFEKIGVAFHFVAERIDSTSAQGRFLRNVLLAAAEMQSEDASAFLKSTWEQRAREGRLHGGNLPIWLRKTPSGLEVIPEQVTAIHRLIELRMGGLGYMKLAGQLNLEGFRTPRGKYWSHGMTYKYLQPSYLKSMLGTGYYGRSAAEPVEIPDAYPAVITKEDADRITAIQKLYSEDYGRKPVQGLDWMVSRRWRNDRRSASTIHLLSGIVFCPACGARLVATNKSVSENRTCPHTYCCPHRRSRTELHRDRPSSVIATSLEDAVLRVLRSVLVMPPPAPELKAKAVQPDAVAAIQTKIDRLLEMHLDARIEEDDFKRAYAVLLDSKASAVERQKQDSVPEQHRQAVELAAKSDLTREELRQLVLLMVERVEAPLMLKEVPIRVDRTSLRRLARITLRFPTQSGENVFLSAIYTPRYGGFKKHVALAPDGSFNPGALIGERPRDRARSPISESLVNASEPLLSTS